MTHSRILGHTTGRTNTTTVHSCTLGQKHLKEYKPSVFTQCVFTHVQFSWEFPKSNYLVFLTALSPLYSLDPCISAYLDHCDQKHSTWICVEDQISFSACWICTWGHSDFFICFFLLQIMRLIQNSFVSFSVWYTNSATAWWIDERLPMTFYWLTGLGAQNQIWAEICSGWCQIYFASSWE